VAFQEFDSFRAELSALLTAIDGVASKTLRDDALRERFRTLFRSWSSNVLPSIRSHVRNTRELYKLSGELERLAQLPSKYKPTSDYRRRLRNSIQLADGLVISLPLPSEAAPQRQELFLPELPDLPMAMVPDRLIGRQTKIKEFLQKHPFDRSVFVMIRYRKRNRTLIERIKSAIAACEIDGRPFFPIVASEHSLTDDLYNPIACLLCCSLGVAVFDRSEPGEVYNPNVAYELGMMHLLNRSCLLLKHDSLGSLQTDILMKLYEHYSGPVGAGKLIRAWRSLTPSED
jgi:hypothetical protein